jgi:hypothetical protein
MADPVPFVSLPAAVPLLDAVLWVAAFAFYGLGDYATTVAATTRPGARERNPVLRRLFDGLPLPPAVTFAAAKLLAFAFFVLGYLSVDPSALRPLVPGVVAAIGVLVTVQNLRVLGRDRSARRRLH